MPTATVELVSGILIADESGGKPELIKEIEIKSMTGLEEDLFTNRREAAKGTMFVTMLSGQKTDEGWVPGCISQIGHITNDGKNCKEIILDMFQPDKVKIMMSIRAISHEEGEEIFPKLSCPECGATNTFSVNLMTDFKVIKKPDPYATGGEFVLPESGKLVKYRFLTNRDDSRIVKIRKSDKDALVSAIMNLGITEIEGEKFVGTNVLQKYSTIDRRALRKEIQEKEGSIETEIINECPECGAEFTVTIDPLDLDFFLGSSG